MMYEDMQVDCRKLPSTKTALKTKNENKLYKQFTSLLYEYLQNDLKDIYYQSELSSYFRLFFAAKSGLADGTIYDLSTQLVQMQNEAP